MSDLFYQNLEKILRLAADEDEDESDDAPEEDVLEEDPLEEGSPEEAIADKEEAGEQRQKDETLPPLGEGEEILDSDSEEAFGPALTPSLWEQAEGQDGLIVFVKKDSESDPEATKGRYTKKLHMDIGEPDDAIVDYINAFLVHNKIKTTPLKHFTMRTDYGPSSVDEYDNGVVVTKKWQDGKYSVHVQWKSDSITVPPVFKKEVNVPDELKAPEEEPEAPAEESFEEDIPSLEDLEDMPEAPEGEEGGEEPEEGAEEAPEEDEEPEKEEEAAFAPKLLRKSRLSKRLILAEEEADPMSELSDLFEDLPSGDAEKKELPKEDVKEESEPTEEPEEQKKPEEVPSKNAPSDTPKDQVKEVTGILDAPTEAGKTVFEEFLDMAMSNQWLYPRDFKDLQKYRDAGDLEKLRQKEEAMAHAILARVKGVIKQKKKELAAFSRLSKRVAADLEITDAELVKIIADKIEEISTSPMGESLMSDVRPSDIVETPEQEDVETEEGEPDKSISERLVEEFFEEKGEMPDAVRYRVTDIDLLRKVQRKFEDDGEEVSEEDLEKAKKMIIYHQQATGDLKGNE